MIRSLRSLRTLVAVAEAGSVSGAARALNVSQPAVSGALAEAEADFGVAVFVRQPRGVSLTAPGGRIVNEARLLLARADEFWASARALGEAVRGEIAVGCFPTLAPHYLPGLLARFAARHPGVSVRLEEGDQEALLAALAEGRVECALSYDFAVPESVEAEHLLDLPPHAILPAGHRLAGGREVDLAELAGEPLVLFDLPHSRDYFAALYRARGLEPRIGFRSRSYELVRAMVGNGHGYAIHNAVPRTAHAYDGSALSAVRLAGEPVPVRVTSLRLRGLPLRPAVEAFRGFLREAFAPGGFARARSLPAAQ